MAPAAAPPPPRASSASSPVPPPPRSSTPNASPAPAEPALPRPGTPGSVSGRSTKPAPPLALPSVLRDLELLRGSSALADLAPPPASVSPERLRRFDSSELDRAAAVGTAEAFVGEMEAVLALAATELESAHKVERAEELAQWSDAVSSGLKE